MKLIRTSILIYAIVACTLAGTALPTDAARATIHIKGSDTVLPVASAWAEAYMKERPEVTISVTGGGTGVGIASLINGSCHIANASRAAKPKEIAQARDRNIILKATTVAKDGIAIIVNPSNPLDNLSIKQLNKLYTDARSWKEVGGLDVKVVAIGRDSSSGTYAFFQEVVLKGKPYRRDMLSLPSNVVICETVAQDEGAVGYVGLAFAKKYAAMRKVKVVAVSGVVASDETVRSGKYPLWRPLYCYTNGKPSGVIGDFLKFATSEQGQAIVCKVGYVPR